MSTTPRGGRPRDPAIGERILEATRSLLTEVGYASLTIEAVAARAEVGKPTVYRRYPSKASLVFDAVFGQTKSRPIPDSHDLTASLGIAYGWAVDEFASPEARAALPGLLADLSANERVLQVVREQVIEPEMNRVRDAMAAAQERGEIRTDADLSLAIDAFTGTALVRAILVDRPLDHAFGGALVELLMYGLVPR